MHDSNIWISFYPVVGKAIIDITLVSCDAFNFSITSCNLPKPVSLYRQEHDFVVKTSLPSTNVWTRIENKALNIDTRWQIEQCYNKTEWLKPICSKSPIDAYAYTEPTFNSSLSICFLGASHGQKLFQYSRKIGMQHTFDIRSRFARDIVPTFKNVTAQKCEYVVLHTGQWDLGWPEGKITPIEEFEHHLERGLKMYKNSGYKLYVVSNNYNPLGNAFLFCPPGDWRRPDYQNHITII